MTEEEVEPPVEATIQSGSPDPPENPVDPPPPDFEALAQAEQAKMDADVAARQEAKEQVAEEMAVNNDAVSKALDALRSGEPLQNEPI